MAFHFIIIVSDFSGGRRYGWHYSSEERLDKEYIESSLNKVKKKCGNVQFGIHKLATDSTDWNSVVDKDSFFVDVIVTEDIDDFIGVVSNDQELTAYDLTKFILTVRPVSHLKLQKLIYYIYAEFLIRTGEKLFKEPIVAYKYGPVVEDVFEKYRVHGSSKIDYVEDAKFSINADKNAFTPSLMKILSSEYGMVVVECVVTVLEKYIKTDPFVLVDKTHRQGGPWSRVYVEGMNRCITDDLITQYHHVTE
ncbi:type II toxin-antitoxin system antitoxin SocA domain-containing protein [Metabacillus dongyingensis]|uniref:Panacea domain-containing protein n=1 Tax=Metabacillus dongyingensis TaxID=2874282 RepID=UPI003B8B6954